MRGLVLLALALAIITVFIVAWSTIARYVARRARAASDELHSERGAVRPRVLLVCLAVAAGLMLTGCGLADSAPNEIGLIYSGGITEDKSFQGVLDPGANSNNVGFGSTVYKYRTDQRTYIFDKGWEGQRQLPVHQRSVDAPILQCVSRDNVRLSFPAQFYFTLHWGDHDLLRQFHEKLGFKTKAYTDDGWVAMLDQYVRPTAERAAEVACLQHDWRQLYTSEEARRDFANDTVAAFKRGLVDVVGGNYFCGPKYDGDGECDDFTLQVGKPIPPEKITSALEDTEAAKERTKAQVEENLRIEQQALGEQRLVDLYGPYVAAIIKAIEQGKVQFMVVPDGQGVTVPAPTSR